jgi:DNA-binding PadR family transcriptional regulator
MLHILLALAPEPLHGYGIMQVIARQSEGAYKVGPGTLYDNLKKFLDWQWVEEFAVPEPTDSRRDDPRRRYYRLTQLGRDTLNAEITRLESVVREARLHLSPLKTWRS